MVESATAPQREDLRALHQAWPWLAYALGLLLVGYQDAGAYVFILGMLRHWKFWLLFFAARALVSAWSSHKRSSKC
jgi:hypothetical protein